MCRLLGLLKPIMGETRRNQLKGYIAAYKSGLGGRSCYRKYPCYANNMSTKRGKGSSTSSRRVDGAPSNNVTSAEVDVNASASVEERIVYDLANATTVATANSTGTVDVDQGR